MPRKKQVSDASPKNSDVVLDTRIVSYAEQILQLEPYETMLLTPTGDVNREYRYVLPFHGADVYKVLRDHNLDEVEVIAERFSATDRILICVRQKPYSLQRAIKNEFTITAQGKRTSQGKRTAE